MKRTLDELIDHLLDNSIVDEVTGCILWQGCTAGKGYGVIHFEGRQMYIHRLAYSIEYPNEKLDVIRHSCDTPNCWRIEHLFNGSTQDNVDDKVLKKRHIFGKDNYNSHLTEQDIKDIRSSSLNLYRLAEKYNVTASNIYYIRTKKTWRHVI